MSETDRFKHWHKVECSRLLGEETKIKDRVEEAMRPWNLKVEYLEEDS